ncbi:reverse transcriptase domain-containing protein [Tanacetum coccineum]
MLDRGSDVPKGDGGRRNETFLHLLSILDSFLDVLFKSVKLAKFLVYLVSSHGWLGSSTQPTPRKVDRKIGRDEVLMVNLVEYISMRVARVVSRVVLGFVLVILRGCEALVSMDIVGPLPEAPGKLKYLIVAIDYFTKWLEVWSTDYYHHKQWNLVDQRAIQVLGKGFGNKGHLRITTPSKRSGGTGKPEHNARNQDNVTPRRSMMGRRTT